MTDQLILVVGCVKRESQPLSPHKTFYFIPRKEI